MNFAAEGFHFGGSNFGSGFGGQDKVAADGAAETVEPIPDPESFDVNPRHTVIDATPFGVAFKEFES